MDRLTPLATAFLDAEDADPRACLAIGSFAIFEGPAPDYDQFVSMVARRLMLVERCRQKLRTVPFNLAAPAWVDDPDVDLTWHVRSTALPEPGGPEEIGRLMSRVMAQRMDRSRPLWEYWLCTGLAGGRWGLLSKLHHSVADGISGTELYGAVLDATPDPAPLIVDDWQPAPPSDLEFAARAIGDLALKPVRQLRAGLRSARSPVQLARSAGRLGRGLLAFSGALSPLEPSSLTGELSGSRRYAWTSTDLADALAVGKQFGVSLNDVALAAVTGGFRRLLIARGEAPGQHTLRSLVPVSTRQPGAAIEQDNQVSLMLPYLPVEADNGLEQLRLVHERLAALRRSHEPEAGTGITSLAESSVFPAVALGLKVGWRLPQHQVATVTTNVPGPRRTLYCLGRRLVEILPYVPIADRLRTGIAIFSYDGLLTFGITADYDGVPDVQLLAVGIAASFDTLRSAAATAGASGKPGAR
jgi:WS/DGAT/MGAT family acyltransferase